MIKLILFFVLITIPLVYGAQGLITEVDFSKENIQGYKLEDGDGISFFVKDKYYIISIDSMGKIGVRLKSFIYKENGERETFYIPLNKKFSYKLDFDKDDIYDLKVNLANIEEGKAIIILEKIEEKKFGDEISSSAVKEKKNINIKGIIITTLIVLAGLVAYFTFRKK